MLAVLEHTFLKSFPPVYHRIRVDHTGRYVARKSLCLLSTDKYVQMYKHMMFIKQARFTGGLPKELFRCVLWQRSLARSHRHTAGGRYLHSWVLFACCHLDPSSALSERVSVAVIISECARPFFAFDRILAPLQCLALANRPTKIFIHSFAQNCSNCLMHFSNV